MVAKCPKVVKSYWDLFWGLSLSHIIIIILNGLYTVLLALCMYCFIYHTCQRLHLHNLPLVLHFQYLLPPLYTELVSPSSTAALTSTATAIAPPSTATNAPSNPVSSGTPFFFLLVFSTLYLSQYSKLWDHSRSTHCGHWTRNSYISLSTFI